MLSSLTLILIILVLTLISQFGGKLAAKNALVWWMIFIFLIFVTANPDGLTPITHALGITLVSNFVFASLILFLIFQAIQESTVSTEQQRKLRSIVTHFAAQSFLKIKNLSPKKHIRVLIVFPAYNEEACLPELIQKIEALSHPELELIPCIVNDGSIDQTESLLESKAPSLSTHHASNVGVSGVLLTGFKIAKKIDADYIVQCDSDGQHPLTEISNLVFKAQKEKTDLLIGSRYVSKNVKFAHQSSSTIRKLGSLVIRLTLKLFSRTDSITDPTSGFRVYSKRAALTLELSMPDQYPEPESIALLLSQKLIVLETPVDMESRMAGESSLSGLKGAQFMIKVVSALLGLRLRTWIKLS